MTEKIQQEKKVEYLGDQTRQDSGLSTYSKLDYVKPVIPEPHSKHLKGILYQLVSDSSVHGLPRIFKTENLFLKFVWAFFFIIYAGMCTWFITESILAYLKYETVTSVNIERKNEMTLPAIHICYNNKQELHIYRISRQLIDIDYKSVGFEVHYGVYKCIMLNTGRNYTGHKVPLLKSHNIGKADSLKLAVYHNANNDFKVNIQFGDNRIYPHYKGLKSLIILGGIHTDISLSKLSDSNLGEPYNNCMKKSNPESSSFASESIKNASKLGFDYTYHNCYEYYACRKLADKLKCTCPGIYETNSVKICYDVWGFITEYSKINYTLECQKLCPIECDFVYYTATSKSVPVSERAYGKKKEPFEEYFNEIYPNQMPIFDLDKISSFFIYYEDHKETKLQEVEKMTFADLVSTIGGCLGLFLGLSLFSLIEMVEMLTYLIYWIKDSYKNRRISPDNKKI